MINKMGKLQKISIAMFAAFATLIVIVSAVSAQYGGGGGGSNNQLPVAIVAGSDPRTCSLEISCYFDASKSYDPDGRIVKYTWTWDTGEKYDSTAPTISLGFSGSAGVHKLILGVTDDKGATGSKGFTVNWIT